MSDSNLSANSVPMGRAYEILEDGAAFGVYSIVRCLAYDMLGSLYLVQNRDTGQRETLFVFPKLVAQDKDFHERFITQTKKLCSLKHPNILNFTQAVIVENNHCLVGESFEGLNIPDHLMMLTGSHLSTPGSKQAVNLPPAQVTPIIEQVLAGLGFAHENKVQHLNLNPTKILRSTFGEVKVYGYHFLAILGQELFEMLVSAGIPPLKLDPNRSYLGTTDILSPEARLRQTLEYRSDLYAIGVDTHWMLTGAKPTSPYQPPSQLLPGIEPGWDAFIMRCLQRTLDKRYPSAKAALTDLRNLAQLTPLAEGKPLELLLPEGSAAAPATPPAKDKKAAEPKKPAVKKNKPVKPPRRARKPLTPIQRLLYLGLPALLAVGLGSYLYVMLMTGDDDSITSVPVRARNGETPRLTLIITPRSSLVRIDKEVFAVTDGELPLIIAPGTYTIIVEAPQHTTKRINYTLGIEPDHLTVPLDPAWPQVIFVTAPGATITAHPQKGAPINLGVAADNGVLKKTNGLDEGVYSFEAAKEDYQPAEVADYKLELTKSYKIEIKPIAKPATVRLISQPSGITVRLDGKDLGKTPLTTQDIPPDSDVTVTLELSGYQPAARTLPRVQPGAVQGIDLGPLSAKTGEVTLTFTIAGRAPTLEELRDTKITFNDLPYPGNTKDLPKMLEGNYHVVIQHPDYFPSDQTVAVLDGKITALSADLLPRPAHLTIHTQPAVPNLNIFLNDQPLAPAANSVYDLPPGQTNTVRVESRNFATAVRVFKLGPNQSATWEAPMLVIAPPKPGENYTVPYLNLALNWIPDGQFTMGSPGNEPERKASEGPATVVKVPAGFWAGVFEVTQDAYETIMGENPSQFGHDPQGQERYPVDNVSWTKAMEFARRVNVSEQAAQRVPEGYEYRLPTEAEWEYLARAGTNSPFNFGDHADGTMGNFKGAYPPGSGSILTSADTGNGTKPVGSYHDANKWGLYDIHGNVAEWVLDAFKSRLPGGEITDPSYLQIGDANSHRIYRGGGWKDSAQESRSAFRDLGQGARPDTTDPDIGLRLVLAPKIATAKP